MSRASREHASSTRTEYDLRRLAYMGKPLSPREWRELDRLRLNEMVRLSEQERPVRNWDGRGRLVAGK